MASPSDPLMREEAEKARKRAAAGGQSSGKSKEAQSADDKSAEIEANKLFQEWKKRQQAGEKILPPPILDEVEESLSRKASVNQKRLDELKSQFNQFRQYDNQPVYLMKAWVLLAEILIEEMKAKGEKPSVFGLFTKLLGMKLFGFDGKERAPQRALEGIAKVVGGICDLPAKSLRAGFDGIAKGDRSAKDKRIDADNMAPTISYPDDKVRIEGLAGDVHSANRTIVNERLEEVYEEKGYKLDEDGYLLRATKTDDGTAFKTDAQGERVYEQVGKTELVHQERLTLSDLAKEISLERTHRPTPSARG